VLNTLKELCRLNGVSGDEDEVCRCIRDRAEPFASSIRADSLGNLIVFKRGKKSTGNRLMLAAHMDEVGVIITRVTEEGFLKFDFVGGVDRRVAIGKPVVIGEKKVPGVIGLKAIHLTGKEERKKAPKTESLYIDIGAKDKASAEKLAEPGDYGAFVCRPEEFGDGLFKARAIDDRVGCAIMLKLLEEDLPLDVTFAFTAQEEVGTRGAFGAAFSVTPEIALVLETTTAAGLPGVESHRRVCAPGRGPVISYMDGATIYDRELFEILRRLAEENGIPWQTKEYIAGGNDARTIQRTKAGVRVAAMSAATRYLHAPASVGSVADFEHMLQLTRLFLDEMARRLEEGIKIERE
jgi:endoglucanase